MKPLSISLELPSGQNKDMPSVQVYDQYVSGGVTNPATGIVSMHYYYPDVWMSEPMAWLRLEIHRLSASEYDVYSSGKMYSFGTQELFFGKDFPQYCPEMQSKTIVSKRISASGHMLPFLFYRKDYRTPDGDVILAGVQLWPGLLESSSISEDKKAVERILNSIQFSPDYKDKK